MSSAKASDFEILDIAEALSNEAARLGRENVYSAQGITRDWLNSLAGRLRQVALARSERTNMPKCPHPHCITQCQQPENCQAVRVDKSRSDAPQRLFVRLADICDGRVTATTYPFPEGQEYVLRSNLKGDHA